MSPTWRKEDQSALMEARRMQVVLAEVTATLTAATGQLNELLAELSAEAGEDDDD